MRSAPSATRAAILIKRRRNEGIELRACPQRTLGCGSAKGVQQLIGPGVLTPPPPPGAPGPFALSDEAKLRAFAAEAGLTPLTVVDVPCPWIYPNLDTALKGMLSAGPAERAIRASSFERARDARAGSIKQYRTAAGAYHLNNTFRYLIARA